MTKPTDEQMKKAEEVYSKMVDETDDFQEKDREDAFIEYLAQALADQQAELAPTQDNSPKKHAKYVDKFRERGFKRINNPYNKPTQDSGEPTDWPTIRDRMHQACLSHCGDEPCCYGKQNSIVYEAFTAKDKEHRTLLADQQAKHEAELRRVRGVLNKLVEVGAPDRDYSLFIEQGYSEAFDAFDEAIKVKK